LALHACEERFISQRDLLAQSLSDILPHTVVHESLIMTTGRFA
jgi:hypothetical protein